MALTDGPDEENYVGAGGYRGHSPAFTAGYNCSILLYVKQHLFLYGRVKTNWYNCHIIILVSDPVLFSIVQKQKVVGSLI
jgi:hypothetical protein